jgi:hypothetical protein
MAFVHGKGTSVLLNAFDVSAFLNSADQTISVETAETTCFGSSSKSYVVGLRDGTVSVGGYFDGAANAVDSVLSTAIGSTASSVLSIADEGLTIGNRCLVAQAIDTSYQITGAVGDAVSVSAEFQVEGTGTGGSGAYRGVVLSTLASQSGTGPTSLTAVDNGASSANGLVANLHVTSNTASLTVKIQHSTDNVTFTDLVTFTAVAGTGSEHKITTGTVNRYLRVQWSGTSATRTFAVTAARK